MARKGLAFATSDEARVVYALQEGEDPHADAELVDVPKDGKTVGEIVVRGNIVMKEVKSGALTCGRNGLLMDVLVHGSISGMRMRLRRRSGEGISARAIWRCGIQMDIYLSRIEARISSYLAERCVVLDRDS